MYPDQAPQSPTPAPGPTPSTGAPIDYLNQISAKPQKKSILGGGGMKQKIVFTAAGLIVALILIAVIGVLVRPNVTPDEQLAAKLKTTESIASGAQSTIQSSQLRAFNTNLTLQLTNAVRDIHQPLLNNGIDSTKLNTQIVASEAGTDISARLTDAKLNGVYDATYAREIAYQLELITGSMQQIYKTTSSASLKTFLATSYKNLTPIQTEFEDFNDANS